MSSAQELPATGATTGAIAAIGAALVVGGKTLTRAARMGKRARAGR